MPQAGSKQSEEPYPDANNPPRPTKAGQGQAMMLMMMNIRFHLQNCLVVNVKALKLTLICHILNLLIIVKLLLLILILFLLILTLFGVDFDSFGDNCDIIVLMSG